MTTEAVCELLRQIEGIDLSMLGQYGTTVRKVGVAHSVTDTCMLLADS